MEFSPLQKKLLNDYQTNLPLCEKPFSVIAKQLGVSEQEVMQNYRELLKQRYISRIGAVVNHKMVGSSTLAAMAVARSELEAVANFISSLPEVNHNYEREHRFNLWFVLTAQSETKIDETLVHIQTSWPQYPILNLPMIKSYHIDLGFPLWN